MSFYSWQPYVPVAERRRNAAVHAAKLAKKGETVSPVVIEGRTIARTFWGKSWCENLERYSDYANRLPRGRTYVRNGSVIDLKIARGEIAAQVSGSSIYKVRITVAPASQVKWKALCKDCAGSIDSLVELLQGRFSKGVMERVCLPEKGLFPSPKDIKLSCSCPDGARMCKHVAAVLYGVGARFDQYPELLFSLREVDHRELVSRAGEGGALTKKPVSSKRVMESGDLASIFGLEMADGAGNDGVSQTKNKGSERKPPAPKKGAASNSKSKPQSGKRKKSTSATEMIKIASVPKKSAKDKPPAAVGTASARRSARGETAANSAVTVATTQALPKRLRSRSVPGRRASNPTIG